MGPSHHAYMPGVALSKFEAYETPLGDIPLDTNSDYFTILICNIQTANGLDSNRRASRYGDIL